MKEIALKISLEGYCLDEMSLLCDRAKELNYQLMSEEERVVADSNSKFFLKAAANYKKNFKGGETK